MKLNTVTILFVTILASCVSENANDQQKETNEFYYQEPHRPQFHFSPDSMWMNDPNGMVYLDGEYHLFYQHYPDSNVWGPMHWGHAVSTDLMHWEHLPIALFPDDLGYIFSGSAVYDRENTSGLGSEENPPLIAIFTYHDAKGEKEGKTDYQTQGIAFSLDKGRSWTKYEHNPVLPNPGIRDFRDPKVMWHAPSKKWIMTLAVADHISFYSSSNLLEWNFESDFGVDVGAHGGVWECPDLFELPIEGTNDTSWVLLVSINPGGPNGGSATQFFVGDFDGNHFNPEDTVTRWLDYGMDNYAGVTYANVDDRRVLIGWMSNWMYAQVVPTQEWRSAMTIPRTLHLAKNERGKLVKSVPVKELKSIMRTPVQLTDDQLQNSLSLKEDLRFEQPLFTVGLTASSGKPWKVLLSNELNENVGIGYDPAADEFYVDRSAAGKNKFHDGFFKVVKAPRLSGSQEMKVNLVIDVSSVELFADGGLTVMTNLFFPEKPWDQITFEGVDSAGIASMRSVW